MHVLQIPYVCDLPCPPHYLIAARIPRLQHRPGYTCIDARNLAQENLPAKCAALQTIPHLPDDVRATKDGHPCWSNIQHLRTVVKGSNIKRGSCGLLSELIWQMATIAPLPNQLLGRLRTAPQEPLTVVTAQVIKYSALFLSLYALGQNLFAQIMGHGDDRLHQGYGLLVVRQSVHELLIYLYDIDGKLLQVTQTGIAFPEIVQSNPYAPAGKCLQNT